MTDLLDEIKALKKQKDATILAHYYQDGEIQELADFTGDSLKLARAATKVQTGTIVIHSDDDAAVAFRRLDDDAGSRPLARVVEQIPEHLVEIFALTAEDVAGVHAYLDCDATIGVQSVQRARERLRQYL